MSHSEQRDELSHCLAWDMNHPFIHTPLTHSHLGHQINCQGIIVLVHETLTLSNNATLT